MGLLKVPKYLEMPDGARPVTRCRPGDIEPYVILTNMREQVEKAADLLTDIRTMVKGSEAALTVTGMREDLPVTISKWELESDRLPT